MYSTYTNIANLSPFLYQNQAVTASATTATSSVKVSKPTPLSTAQDSFEPRFGRSSKKHDKKKGVAALNR
jgi:hypothetical protein